jgi:fibronectin-binding autotransporter adhesin
MNRLMKILTSIRLSVFIIAFVLFFQTTVFGLNFQWIGRDGDWSDRKNWSVRQVPDAFYHLAIIPDGNATIDADRFKLESLYVLTGESAMGDGSLSIINGGGLDVKQYVMVNALSGTSLLEVGQDSTLNARIHTMIAPTGRGVLNVTDGGFYKANLLNIGNTLDSNAKITVSGHGSRLAAKMASLGWGEVQIDINDGGKLLTDRFFCETGPGKTTVTVSGPNSHFKSKEIWWQSNDTGTALLNVKDGGYMNTDLLNIDTLSGSDSKVTISGGGHFEAQKAHIGFTKNGMLNIEDRAFVDIKYFTIGDHFDSSGTVTVKGPGTKLLAGENAKIGCRGEGTVNIINGATMKSGKFMVGFLKGKGNVLVSGQGSFLETREAFIGAYFDGEGFLNITDGGFMSTDLFFLGLRLDSTGSAIISGPESSLDAKKAWIGYGEEGILNILDGGYMRSGEFKVGDGFYKDEEGVHARGTVTVSGHGSLLETENTVIGSEGQGKLSVVNGGFLRSSDLIAGRLNGSFGGITVSGPGSRVESKDVWIGNLGSGTLDVEDNALMTSEHLFIGLGPGKSGTVTVSDLDSRFETESVQIGISGQGALHITDGGRMVSGEIIAGSESGGRGIATVSGQNSLIQTNTSIIGAAGEGRLDIADGGRLMTKNVIIGSEPGVRDMGYTNTVTVTGPGSVLETESAAIGYYGTGGLDIVDGGNMVNQGRVVAGYLSGSKGIVSVSGKGSRLESVAAQIGYYSQGTLDITGGGTVHLTNLELGKFPGASGTATISGIGSRLEAEATCIGNEGEGILNITEGGQVYTKRFSYGQYPDATGTVTVSGPGSRLDTRTAWIQFGAGRKLEILDGGHMRSENMGIMGSTIAVSGENSLLTSQKMMLAGESPDAAISVTDNGELKFEESFEIAGKGALKVSNGGRFTMGPDSFFNISSPGATAAFTDTAFFDGHVHVNGTLSAPASVFSSGSLLTGSQGVIQGDVTMNGTLSPGGANDPVSSPATLFINGNYTHEKDSRYVAGIDVDTQVSDRVEVSGSTTLNGGTIEAVWTGHVTGEERFTVLTSSSIPGRL